MPTKEYGALKTTVPGKEDKASAYTALREFSDSLGKPTGASTGQLLIVQNTGSVAYKAMKGDATLAEDGTLTIANEAINAAKIAKLAVTAAKLAAEAVETAKIAEKAVTNAKLADEAVNAAKVAAANKDGEAATASMRTLGTGAKQAAAGNDVRLWGQKTGEPTNTGGVPAASKYLPVNIEGLPYKILLG